MQCNEFEAELIENENIENKNEIEDLIPSRIFPPPLRALRT